MRTRWTAWPTAAALLVAGLAAGGCGSSAGSSGSAGASSSAAASESAAASPAPRGPLAAFAGCVRPGKARPLVDHEQGGYTDTAALLGSGPDVVIVSHQSPGYPCQMDGVAKHLLARGYRVLLTDAGVDPVSELTYFTARLRHGGARHVVLLGASAGAMQSIVAGVKTRPPVDGVVSLSADSVLAGEQVAPYAARLTVPVLFLGSQDDGFAPGSLTRSFEKHAKSRDKRVIIYPGTRHGVDLTTGPDRKSVYAAIDAFLNKHSLEKHG